MKYSRQIRTFGYIKQATKQGRKEREKDLAEVAERNRIKEICLNCTEPKCVGRCRYYAKKVREDG